MPRHLALATMPFILLILLFEYRRILSQPGDVPLQSVTSAAPATAWRRSILADTISPLKLPSIA